MVNACNLHSNQLQGRKGGVQGLSLSSGPRDKVALTLRCALSASSAVQVIARNLPSNELQGIKEMFKAHSLLQTLKQRYLPCPPLRR